MSRPSRVVQGAILGGIIAVAIHCAVRFTVRHWWRLLALLIVIETMSSCSR